MDKLISLLVEQAKRNFGVMLLLILFIWGYFGVMAEIDTKADKDTVYAEIREVSNNVQHVVGEISGMAKYFTGTSSFNGDSLEIYPPASYIIDNRHIKIPSNGFDSCFCGVIRDTCMTRSPWFCYWNDSTGALHIEEFK